jgi:hypothetical protein
MAALRGAETIGRLLGSPAFLDSLAALTRCKQRPHYRIPFPYFAEATGRSTVATAVPLRRMSKFRPRQMTRFHRKPPN